MPTGNFSNQVFVKSLLIQIPANESTKDVDLSFAYATQLIGATIIVADCKYGDTGKVCIINPADQSEIDRFGDVHLPEGSHHLELIMQNGGADIPANLIFRATVGAIDSNGRNVIVWLILKK